ncbi:MAG: hypothetical protein Kow0089_25000 [Desulfobulbaceae bacterium]
MYLARRFSRNAIYYLIRESYSEAGVYHHRDLLELGVDPGRYIRYSGGRTFVIDDVITERLQDRLGTPPDPFELERLFYPFVDPEVRYRLDSFGERGRYRRWKPASGSLRKRILAGTHPFDRRRAHFLRFGQTDQRNLLRALTLYKVLLDKSRDEIEQYFIGLEMALKPHEYKRYMYVAFNLQAFFTQRFAHTMPEALDIEKMDSHFIDQVCAIHGDEEFWKGYDRDQAGRLSEYLVRYVVMYFDYSFTAGTGWEEYIRSFMDGRRRFVPPKSSKRMSMKEAATVFGVSRATLAAMDLQEIKRLFRKKARELHPDKGGDHDAFIELSSAYQELLWTRAGKR